MDTVGDWNIAFFTWYPPPPSPPLLFSCSRKTLSRLGLYITLIALFQSLIVYILIARENGTLRNSKTSTTPYKPLNGNSGKRESFSAKRLSDAHYLDSHIAKQHNCDYVLAAAIFINGSCWHPALGDLSLCCAWCLSFQEWQGSLPAAKSPEGTNFSLEPMFLLQLWQPE